MFIFSVCEEGFGMSDEKIEATKKIMGMLENMCSFVVIVVVF
jgi:predicted naringenin-chalcone synthase